MAPTSLERHRSERAGRRAETVAVWFLRLKGYRILARRYATGQGEIDIIARRGRLVAFVEVKRRRHLDRALEALDRRQCRRIMRAAQVFMQRFPSVERLDLRFDLIAVGEWRIVHVEDAFRPDS
ncbi:MAG: YraN family protein [Geminicoccaceae bacterium]|nr:YraN family protein [Geminicoccaceae bacterium]